MNRSSKKGQWTKAPLMYETESTTLEFFIMTKRGYTQIQTALPDIHRMIVEGKLYRGIADYYGVKNEKVIKNLIYREKHKSEQGIPKSRGRKPAKKLAEYKYENKQLMMENELLRDFLQFTERK